MQRLKLKYLVSERQQFFIEKTLEVLYKDTIDTYRLRIHNPKTIIKELVDVCLDLKHQRLRNHDYASALAKETLRALTTNHHLKFSKLDENFFKSVLKKFSQKDYAKIIHAGNLILQDNQDYFERLHKVISGWLTATDEESESPSVGQIMDYSIQIHYYYIELVDRGYSRYYLDRFSKAIFLGLKKSTSFAERFEIVHGLYAREDEKFEIIFGLQSPIIDLKSLQLKEVEVVPLKIQERVQLSLRASGAVAKYLESNKQHLLLQLTITCADYYRAWELSKAKILEVLDRLYVTYSKSEITLLDQVAVVGSRNPEKSEVYSNRYRIEGFRLAGYNQYRKLSEGLDKIFKDETISKESKNKLIAGIRNLRLGTEANDLGSKLLSYWIGVEFIFSIFNANEYTIQRIRDYLKRTHTLIYLKRNLFDFHLGLKRLKLNSELPSFHNNLNYLLDPATHEFLQTQTVSVLTKYRSMYLADLINNPDKVRGQLEKHQQNIDWNITRIYRIRNEIVHNAAVRNDIVTIVSHLRYYLSFSINSGIDFFLNRAIDVDADGEITLEDFFLLQDIELSSIESNKDRMTVEALLKVWKPETLV